MPNCISDEVVIAVIEKGLSSLGESPKKAIWFCLEKDLNLDKQNVPQNIEAFQQALQRFFGLGYNFLETLFLRYLSEATGEDLSSSRSFAECVIRLRTKASVDGTEKISVSELTSASSQFIEE
jgi:hypothetical protein